MTSFPVSVVVPLLDEADNIDLLAAEIMTALAPVADYEILFVDDGSSDATPARLHALVAGNRRIRGLRHAARFGQSMAPSSASRTCSAWRGSSGDRPVATSPSRWPATAMSVRPEPLGPGSPLASGRQPSP